jgi:glucokinase
MEIGHIVVEPDGLPCGCGNRGCLEASASMEWLSGRIAKAREAGIDLGGFPEKFSMAAFIEFLGKNRGIQMIADELIRNICSALGVAVMLLNPDVIVISGSLAGMGEYLTGALREELEKRCFAEAVKELDIEISRLEAFDTPRGAAIMMRDWILSEGR